MWSYGALCAVPHCHGYRLFPSGYSCRCSAVTMTAWGRSYGRLPPLLLPLLSYVLYVVRSIMIRGLTADRCCAWWSCRLYCLRPGAQCRSRYSKTVCANASIGWSVWPRIRIGTVFWRSSRLRCRRRIPYGGVTPCWLWPRRGSWERSSCVMALRARMISSLPAVPISWGATSTPCWPAASVSTTR